MTFLTRLLSGGMDAKHSVNMAAAAAGGATRASKAEMRYAQAFASPTTVKMAALTMGISHVGCLNQVHRYEKRNKIRRLGKRAGYPRQIFFQWIEQ